MTDCGRAVFIHSPSIILARPLQGSARNRPATQRMLRPALEREMVSIVSDGRHDRNRRGAFVCFSNEVHNPLSRQANRPEVPLKAPDELPEVPLKAPDELPEAALKAPDELAAVTPRSVAP